MGVSRRSFLHAVAGAGLLAPAMAACASKGSQGAGLSPTSPTPVPPAPPPASLVPLRAQAQAAGYLYGAAVDITGVNDAGFAAAVTTECNIITSENSLKWAALRPAPDRFDFSRGDTLRDFARAGGMAFRGHTLVWHSSLPAWFSTTVTAQNAERYLTEHITTVVQHYAGGMHSWDVVNEAIDTASGRADGLRNSPWLQMLGPRYLDLAFQTAAAADPLAPLYYNEYGLELSSSGAKRDATLRLLSGLRDRGVPIHGLGIQGHAGGSGWAQFDASGFAAFLRDVGRLGLRVVISELDVKDNNLPADITTRDQAVAAVYRDYLAVALAEPAVGAVITWGLSDKYTWLTTAAARADGQAVRPLPLDSAFNRKPAWEAIAAAFRGRQTSAAAPAAITLGGNKGEAGFGDTGPSAGGFGLTPAPPPAPGRSGFRPEPAGGAAPRRRQ